MAADHPPASAPFEPGARLLLLLIRLLAPLSMRTLGRVGTLLGALLLRVGRDRRRTAERNLLLCFPEWTANQRDAVLREHFAALGRSFVERSVLWHAPRARLERLVHVKGDIHYAERSDKPVMWLVPHFMGLEAAGTAVQLFQRKQAISVYQKQRSPTIDAALKAARLRFNGGDVFPRGGSIRHLVKAVRAGKPFLNLPDQDFGLRDGAFVPFFGIPAATLLAPSRMARTLGLAVQPVIVTMEPDGRGWTVDFQAPWETHFPTDDPLADTARLNAWLADRIREQPAQYLWVHRRFKTRPAGTPDLYALDDAQALNEARSDRTLAAAQAANAQLR